MFWEIVDKIMSIFLLIVPIGIYFVFANEMETIEIVINRHSW